MKYYSEFASILLILLVSHAETYPDMRSFLFLSVVFEERIWLLNAFPLLIFPLAVILNLLAAALTVLIFGIYATSQKI